ncbi:MAG: hypothetical protein ABFD89_06630 [Bryobacteraceae bacterium]
MPVPLEFAVKANSGQFKAEMAQVKAIALGMNRGGGMGGPLHGLSSGGGTSGVMRKSLVIMREIGRGNWARVPGSVTLLLQYMGGLSKILKVTHSETAKYALELEKEAQAMAKAAMAEAVKTGTSKMQVEATKAKLAWQAAEAAALEKTAMANAAAAASSVEAAALETEAAAAKVNANNLAVIAKQREAAAYAEAAAVEGAATTVALGPIGWLIAAIVALGVAAYFTLNHFKKLADQQENLAETTGGVNDQYERQTKRMHDMAGAARKLSEEIANVHKHEKTLAQVSDEAVESLKRNAAAKAELAKESKQIRLDEIELAEKMHKISAMEATRQRAAVEVKAAKDEQAAKEKALQDEKARRESDLKAAEVADKAATAEYEAKAKASSAAGPQGQARVNTLADLTKQEEFLAKQADAIAKVQQDKMGPGLLNSLVRGGAKLRGNAYEDTRYMNPSVTVDGKEMPRVKLKEVLEHLAAVRAGRSKAQAGMTEAEIATANAKAWMDSAAQSRLRIKTDVDKSAQALADQQKNGAALTGARIKDINLKTSAALYEQGQHGVTQGFGLNAQQKVGAYAATPPDFKKLVDAAIRTAQNTDGLRPTSFNPVGNTPARFGAGHRT